MTTPNRYLALLTCGLLSLPLAVQAEEQVDFDLPGAPLEQSLNLLAAQSKTQILFSSDIASGKLAAPLHGRHSPSAALQQLLAGSDLQVQQQDEHSYIVVSRDSAADGTASQTSTPVSSAKQPIKLSAIAVTASRTSSSLTPPVHQVDVIEREKLEQLRHGSDNLATVLAKITPGMSDSSRTITDYGQTLRGREMLILVDGVPLNTNRDSSRNLASIDPALIEQIEVIHGSSAIYGAGATGGIIRITTRPAGGETRSETTLTGSSSMTQLDNDSLGGELQHHLAGSQDQLDYALDLGVRHIGGSFDANGRRIAPEPSQGDLFDSDSFNIGGKLGLRIDDYQRFRLSLSHSDAKQNSDYTSDPSVAALPPGSVPASSLTGLQLDEQNRITNTIGNLEYSHDDLLGSHLSAQAYYRDYFSRFTPFDARAVSTRGGFVDQVMQNSEVFGSRLTLRTPLGENTELVWGGDFNHERSDMPLDVFDPVIYDNSGGLVFEKIGQQTYLPELTTISTGTFAQLQHKFNDQWSIDGGLRYEYATAAFDDFIPLSEINNASPATVQGGKVRYDAALGNIGVVYSPVPGQEIYAAFSQGFQLPDVGVQIRNARAGFDIASSDLEPVRTNNYELGWRGSLGEQTLASLALFYTTSKLGNVQSFNNGLILSRTKERVYGVEGSADWSSMDGTWGVGGNFAWMQGREKPSNGDWQDMNGFRVPPLKLTAFVQYEPGLDWNSRLQATFFASEDYRLEGQASFGRREVDSYTSVDLMSDYRLTDADKVSVGIQNLLNRDYYPLYSQLMRSSSNTSHLPAAGTVLSVSYNHQW